MAASYQRCQFHWRSTSSSKYRPVNFSSGDADGFDSDVTLPNESYFR